MIKSIDHILVAVEELDKAVEDYSLVFGFGPTWQGSHPSLGTKNALFPLENMYLELISKEKANHGDCVHIGRAQVGIVTSGCISTTLNKNIALCRIDVGHSEIGTEVEVGKIDGDQKRISAKVVGFPHYDPQKTRVRA